MRILDTDWNSLIRDFQALGGIFHNVCLKEGSLGRGVFPVDPSIPVKIFTPKNLLLKRDKLKLKDGRLLVCDAKSIPPPEVNFLEFYYNQISWGYGGDHDSRCFLESFSLLPERTRLLLVEVGFVSSDLTSISVDQNTIFDRFKSERSVIFQEQSVLAPVWEMVNHSSFAPSLRVTSSGVETPPIEPSDREVLFKYSKTNSSIYMWSHYGFACRCIWSYSVPFKARCGHKKIMVECRGLQKQSTSLERGYVVQSSDEIVFDSLVIGCLSKSLPLDVLSSALLPFGVSRNEVKSFMEEIQALNLKLREEILSVLTYENSSANLINAISHDIKLIRDSICYTSES